MAGRIPQSFIQDLLARTDIVQVIGERLQLKKAGKEYVALSPFTNEKSPSFTVSPQKQFYHCFSSGKHGTAITFLMEYERLDFVTAVEELAKRAGLTVPREGGAAAPAPVLDGPLDALALAERFYREELRKSQAAIDYLKQRGITGQTAKQFGIGYAPDAWDRLTRQFPDPKHAVAAGLLVRKDDGKVYDFYRHRIMFPVRDRRGRVITFGGRVMPGSDDPRKYLNGRETQLFDKSRNLYGLYEASRGSDLSYVLVVEGYMDCVMLHQQGLTNTVATLGTATTREHLNQLFRVTQRVVFCFDGDRAGRAAAWRALDQALPELQETRECAFMFLPEGEDPDTLVQRIGADEFRRQAQQAQPVIQYLFGELTQRANTGTAEGRAKLVALARPYVSALRAGALRDKILDELAIQARWNRGDVEGAMRSADGVRGNRGPAAAEDPPQTPLSVARPVRRALRALIELPHLAGAADPSSLPASAGVPGLDLLLEALAFFRDAPGASTAQLVELWRDSNKGEAVNRLAATRVELDEKALIREFQDALADLARLGLQARAQGLLQEARQRELSAAEQAELDALSRKLAGQPAGPDTV